MTHRSRLIIATVVGILLLAVTGMPAEAAGGTSGYTVHVVRKGETLSQIAARYGTSVQTLRRLNNLKSTRIVIGQRIIVPLVVARSTLRSSTSYRIIRVTTETDLRAIAYKYGTTVAELMRLNRLYTTRLYRGQYLRVPARNLPNRSGGSSVRNSQLYINSYPRR